MIDFGDIEDDSILRIDVIGKRESDQDRGEVISFHVAQNVDIQDIDACNAAK